MKSAKDLGEGFENPRFLVPFDLVLTEVVAYHDDSHADEEDTLADDHEIKPQTMIYTRDGRSFGIDTPFPEFRKLYRAFWSDLLESVDITLHSETEDEGGDS